ncbi:hypothetical protein FOZ60_004061 [Perkinsus olseni]|uniref:Uncharacterized protein n=1 Tax=Perkinsus olseni TaxID=32597 RepID=A0A7J6PHH0_PEROL|nr:hypothetical protein FOZ60_004061 [Perkinsus olseni]
MDVVATPEKNGCLAFRKCFEMGTSPALLGKPPVPSERDDQLSSTRPSSMKDLDTTGEEASSSDVERDALRAPSGLSYAEMAKVHQKVHSRRQHACTSAISRKRSSLTRPRRVSYSSETREIYAVDSYANGLAWVMAGRNCTDTIDALGLMMLTELGRLHRKLDLVLSRVDRLQRRFEKEAAPSLRSEFSNQDVIIEASVVEDGSSRDATPQRGEGDLDLRGSAGAAPAKKGSTVVVRKVDYFVDVEVRVQTEGKAFKTQPWLVTGHSEGIDVELDPAAPAEVASGYEYLLLRSMTEDSEQTTDFKDSVA